ncbi:MAG TPA: hypothetical protein VM243_09710 [Phycisphaerae bacterium]|nr:hypothetical protein [Phycisphaerae bacterium]
MIPTFGLPTCHRGSAGRRALTFIESVATLCVLALLTAIIAPALAEVGRRGKDAVCLQNLARIAQASIVYSTLDPDGQAIPIHVQQFMVPYPYYLRVGPVLYGGKSGRGRAEGDAMWWGTKNGKGPATRPLNQILYRDAFPDYTSNPGSGRANWLSDERLDLDVFRCPSDGGWTGGMHNQYWIDSKLSSFDHYGTSYSANIMWIGACCGGCCDSNSPYAHRLSDIPSPARTISYQEYCGRWAYWYEPVPPGCPEEVGVVGGWHGQDWLFNVSFVDGHAEPVEIRGRFAPDIGHYPLADWSFWRRVMARGPNWQLDTLPLMPTYFPFERCPPGSAPGADDYSAPRQLIPPG